MKISAEASFPLDDKRNVWIRADADGVDAENAHDVAAAVTEAVTTQAAQAYAHAARTMPEITRVPPTSTFQDD